MCPNRPGLLFLLLLSAGSAAAIPVQSDAIADQFESAEPGIVDAAAVPSESIVPAMPADVTTTVRQLSSDIVRPVAPAAILPADDMTAARAALGQRNVTPQAVSAPGSSAEPDPLHNVLRSLVNVTDRRAATAHASDVLPPPEPQFGLELGEDGRVAVLAAKESLAGAVRTVLDPRAGEDGRISFTLAGVDGFSVSADGASVSVSLRDTTLVSLPTGDAALRGATGEAAVGAPGAPQPADHADLNLVRELIEFMHEVLAHPLTWLVIVLAVIARIVVSVVAARAHALSGRSAQRASRAGKHHVRLADDPPPTVGLRKVRRRSAA